LIQDHGRRRFGVSWRAAVLPLAQGSVACTGKVKERRGRGKLVIAVVGDDGSSSDE